jgi:hypothetical protein
MPKIFFDSLKTPAILKIEPFGFESSETLPFSST